VRYIDYYKVLGVERNASGDAIRRAYITLAWNYHPDLNYNFNNALVKFTLINEAYRIFEELDNRTNFKIKLEQYDKIRDIIRNQHKRTSEIKTNPQ
jgi:curved DNA-binding protein